MKSLLNITVLVSSVLSILSTSLALYDMPSFKDIPSIENGEKVQENGLNDSLKRVYISHDSSNHKNTPVLVAGNKKNATSNSKESLNVFGVKVPNKNT